MCLNVNEFFVNFTNSSTISFQQDFFSNFFFAIEIIAIMSTTKKEFTVTFSDLPRVYNYLRDEGNHWNHLC